MHEDRLARVLSPTGALREHLRLALGEDVVERAERVCLSRLRVRREAQLMPPGLQRECYAAIAHSDLRRRDNLHGPRESLGHLQHHRRF